MWRTSMGDRVLTGPEAALFKGAVTYLVDYVEESEELEENLELGITAFDNVSNVQKLALLEGVSLALLRADIPAPELTALNEATIAAVFANLLTGIEMELDRQGPPDEGDDRDSFRRRVMRALGRRTDPRPDSTDMDEWRNAVDEVEDRILWDLEWDDDHAIDRARVEYVLTGRPRRSYYGMVPPDPAMISLPAIRATFREMRLAAAGRRPRVGKRGQAKGRTSSKSTINAKADRTSPPNGQPLQPPLDPHAS